MDKEFEDWAEEFDKTWGDSKAYQTLAKEGRGGNQMIQNLFGHYIQYKSQEKLYNSQYKSQEKIARLTMGLVIGTWVLALATIALLLVTLIRG